jgi:hypothetical protein
MDFDTPIPFEAALEALTGRKALPTGLSTDQIRAAFSPQIRSLSLYSARTNEAAYLEEVRAAVKKMLDGEWNEATARQHLQFWCDKLGYTPQGGWPGQPAVPPAVKDTLTDLSSDSRTHLVIQTLTRLCTATAFAQTGFEPDNLYNWPAWELVRIYPKQTPRGFRRGKGGALEAVPEEAWPRRWTDAGMPFVDGRMIALKTNPGWQRLGDSGIFRDGTDASYGPFWFNSGGGLEEVGRKECIQIGLISPTEGQEARRVSLVSDLFDGHPERATVADLKSSRQEILEALAEMREAA